MEKDKHSVVLRILDDQNRLTDRADAKAISLLSTLGIFTVFFIANFNKIPLEAFSIFLLIVYFSSVLLAIFQIILAISPRIRFGGKGTGKNDRTDETLSSQPTFFGGIAHFKNVEAYKKSLEDTLVGDEALTDNYIDQVYQVAKINSTKYARVRYAVWFSVMAITSQLALVAYTFIAFR
jgi:hypothetical protein